MENYEEAFALLGSLKVSVIECPMCKGAGDLSRGLCIPCPRCDGSGKTTDGGEPLERWDSYGPN